MINHTKNESKLRFEMMKVLINHLKYKEIEDLEKAFKAIDRDNSGCISFANFQQVLNDHH